MTISNNLISEALKLKPFERVLFIQTLNKSLDMPDESIDNVWIKEVTKRVNSYESGKLSALSLDEFIKQ
jgi:putative addiction module component (TIGR02574 family)